MEEKKFRYSNGVEVTYRFQAPKYDCRHLLIVMSGFNLPDPTIYDFNLLSHCRSNILWIRDCFDGLPAYCLCTGMNFDIEHAVSALIDGVIEFLKPTDASILGASKGGSIALYYGIKHRLDNIITAVPQFRIGSYVAPGTYWEAVGKSMMGRSDEGNVRLLDRYLPDLMHRDGKKDRNIYLFTSRADEQFATEIKPNLALFDKYENFNYIETNSACVTKHTDVTAYNLNLILALIYQFEAGIAPVWGKISNGAAPPAILD
ncbi:hypothetical protein [Burkholderia ubonensis]|uniref:hypothetical protein n=1 Tax=Burkholderia ubonensis TaxID=101571 RepID=UPI00075665BA|nr:hypothetical protein [Burkholderia ubonensis]KWB79393.1 hypothetical protein WL42_12590 [Burkholderia ubonensis]